MVLCGITQEHNFSEVTITRETVLNMFMYKKGSNDTSAILVFSDGIERLVFFNSMYHPIINDTGYYEPVQVHRYTVPEMVSGKRITSIQPEFNISELTDEMTVWLAGKKGLIRQIIFSNDMVSSHKIYDILSQEDVTCINNGYACTSKGNIFKFDSSSQKFKLEANPTIHSLKYITKDLAVGENGTFCKYTIDDSWKEYDTGNETYQFGFLKNTVAGYTALLIDTQWNMRTFVYQNQATVIGSIKPDTLSECVNGKCAIYKSTICDTITIYTSDPEGNHSIPTVCIKRGNASMAFDLKELNDIGYPNSVNILRLSKPIHQLILRNDSAFYMAPAERYVQFNMFDYIWVGETFVRGNSWIPGDTLVISFVQDSLKIKCDNSVGITTQAEHNLQKHGIVYANTKHISISNPNHLFQKIQIFNLQGRLIGEFLLDNRQVFSIPNIFSSDVLIFKFTGKNSAVTYKYCNTR